MSWRGIVTVMLLVGVLLSGWALWSQRDRGAGEVHAAKRPDYVLNDFQIVVLDDEGKESFTVRAPRLERDPEVKTTDIVTPEFEIPPRPGSTSTPWLVRAKTGWIDAEGKELRLRGQVQADSTNPRGKPVQVRTDELNVFPDDNRATSAALVTVTEPGFILNGRGLEADLDAKRIILTSDVKARYERSAR